MVGRASRGRAGRFWRAAVRFSENAIGACVATVAVDIFWLLDPCPVVTSSRRGFPVVRTHKSR